jgi:hypothetical protein
LAVAFAFLSVIPFEESASAIAFPLRSNLSALRSPKPALALACSKLFLLKALS